MGVKALASVMNIGCATLTGMALLIGASGATDLSGHWWIKDRSQIASVAHNQLPLLPAAALQYRHNRALAKGSSGANDASRCLPDGVPRLMLARYPLQILQRPEQITLLHEKMHMVRPIYMQDSHPDELEPTYNGDSIGRWDGDTLVVDTLGFNDLTFIDATGIPHSDALHVTERLSLHDRGNTLRDVITIEDPKSFQKPWSFAVDFARRDDVRLMEDVCTFGPPQRDRVTP
jgi:hypothetical protein